MSQESDRQPVADGAWEECPPRLNEKEIRTYQAAGVNVLYMLPISNDHQAVIREMRKFATTMQAVG
jgi:hypothetical protein